MGDIFVCACFFDVNTKIYYLTFCLLAELPKNVVPTRPDNRGGTVSNFDTKQPFGKALQLKIKTYVQLLSKSSLALLCFN